MLLTYTRYPQQKAKENQSERWKYIYVVLNTCLVFLYVDVAAT